MSQCQTLLITPVACTSHHPPSYLRFSGGTGMSTPRRRYSRRNNESILVAVPRIITF